MKAVEQEHALDLPGQLISAAQQVSRSIDRVLQEHRIQQHSRQNPQPHRETSYFKRNQKSPNPPESPNPPTAEAQAHSTGFQPVRATSEVEHVANSKENSAATSPARVDFGELSRAENPCYVSSADAVIQKDTNPPACDPLDDCDPDIREFDIAGALSPRQLIAIDLLVSGKGDRATAEAVGVTRVTVTRWRLYHLAFRAAMSRRRKETFGVASDRLRGLLHQAIDVLEKQLASEDPKQQMAAIRLMISLSRQCSLQPPDEPESSREIFEREARRHRRARLAKNEVDQPVDEEDWEETVAQLKGRTLDCFREENPAPRETREPAEEPAVIQKDTNGEETNSAAAAIHNDTNGATVSPPPPTNNAEVGMLTAELQEVASLHSGFGICPSAFPERGEEEHRAETDPDTALQIDTNPVNILGTPPSIECAAGVPA